MNTVILFDPARRAWLTFQHPLQVVQAHTLEEVLPALIFLEQQVNQHGLFAAGFIGYEASPAFDPALQAHPPNGFPLLWFGLYARPALSAALPTLSPANPLTIPLVPAGQLPGYARAIDAIKTHIALGNTYQVNYTIRFHGPFTGDPWDLFVHMASAQGAASGSAYPAFIDGGSFAVCSASPELFFRLEGDVLTARPMKGTASRGLTIEQDRQQAAWLQASEKNRAENVMIVDMLRNDMGRVARTGSVHVPELFTPERYPTLWQMTSTVRCVTAASLVDIFRALFPCASITGAPKASTMRIIKSLEDTPRGIYTGCIGYITPGRTAQFNVAIRTALVDRAAGQVTYGVGGGIVWDSTTDDEYRECLLKARVFSAAAALPAFDLLESLAWLPSSPPAQDPGCQFLERHLQRLAGSAEYFNYPLDLDHARQALMLAVENLPPTPHKVRLLVSARGEVTIQAAPIHLDPTPVRLGIAPSPIDPADPFLYHKTTRRQVYEQALAACPGCDEVILWNPAGEVTETNISNLLIHLDGVWCTPPVSCGLLPGTLRAELLDRAEITERVITLADLARAREVHVLNSVRGRRQAVSPTTLSRMPEVAHEL